MRILNMNVTENPAKLRRGAILVLAAVFMIFVLGMAAFSADFGYIQVSKTRLQAAVDAAALAAIDELTNDEVSVNQAVTDLLNANGYDTTNSDIVVTTEYGNWNLDNRIFNAGSVFNTADSIRISVVDSSIPAFFGPVFGEGGYSTGAEAVSTLSSTIPRDIVVVIDGRQHVERANTDGEYERRSHCNGG
jgi:cell division protein FtsB